MNEFMGVKTLIIAETPLSIKFNDLDNIIKKREKIIEFEWEQKDETFWITWGSMAQKQAKSWK